MIQINLTLLTNSGTLVIDIRVETSLGMLSVILEEVMWLLNDVVHRRDLSLLKNLFKDVYVGVIFQIHTFKLNFNL
jgi:hypothetical protein